MRHHLALGAVVEVGRFLPVSRVEREDQIGVAENFLFAAQIERMPVGEIQPRMDVEHRGADGFGKRHQIVEAAFAARHIFGHQHRIFRRQQTVGDGFQRLDVGRHRHRHLVVGAFGSATSFDSGCSCSQAS